MLMINIFKIKKIIEKYLMPYNKIIIKGKNTFTFKFYK